MKVLEGVIPIERLQSAYDNRRAERCNDLEIRATHLVRGIRRVFATRCSGGHVWVGATAPRHSRDDIFFHGARCLACPIHSCLPHPVSAVLIIGAPLDGNNLPVFAQIVNRDRLLGLERALKLFQLNYFHDRPFFSLGGRNEALN